MRIASLVPSATEALFALGLGDCVVAVTHECDHPAAVERLPRLTASVIPPGLPAAETDARVRELTGRGESLYALDEDALRRLSPDLIVTQAVCAVCAVSYDDVRGVAARLPGAPEVLSLDPETLEDVLADLVRLAAACDERARGEKLVAALRGRISAVEAAVAGRPRPRVAALEWLDPVYVGGPWVPERVALAGGLDTLGEPGRKSAVVDWNDVAIARPDVVVAMPCGLYADEAEAEARLRDAELKALGAERIVAVDAASSFSRPGPRLVDGIEALAAILHPGARVEATGVAWRPVWESTAPSSPPR
jgi:iron complex transport system substrate-binding protein